MLSHEPMLAWRLDGPIEFWNEELHGSMGFTSTEVVGDSSHTLLSNQIPNRIWRAALYIPEPASLVRRITP